MEQISSEELSLR